MPPGHPTNPPDGNPPQPRPAPTTHPAWLDREVRARDGTCRYPGCKQPAHRIDLDHTIPFPRGLTVRRTWAGSADATTGSKAPTGGTSNNTSDGSYEWTSMITGRRYTTYPRSTTGDWRGTTNHQ